MKVRYYILTFMLISCIWAASAKAIPILDRTHGLDLYDSEARWYDSLLGRTSTMDPLAEKYYSLSPYLWCAGNPVKFVDPDGKEVIADEDSRDNILNTLTAEESNYVRFDKKGVIDTKLLNETMSTSIIMIALKALANSEIGFIFQVLNKDHKGDEFYDSNGLGENYYRGVTEMPNADFNPSPDNNVYILVGSVLNKEQQVATTAHEAYGHGYFYQLYRNVQAASHTYIPHVETYFDEEFKVHGYISSKIPTNIALEKQIELVTNQAKQNYYERKNGK